MQEISEKYEDLREEIRHKLSALLMDTDEEHPYKTENDVSLFQQPSEGIIWIKLNTFEDYREFDSYYIEDLIVILYTIINERV